MSYGYTSCISHTLHQTELVLFIDEVGITYIKKGSGLEFDMKYHTLHDFRTSTPSKEKSSDPFKDLQKLKLLTNFGVSLTTFLGRVMNYTLNIQFIPPPGDDVRLTSKLVRSFSLKKIFKIIR